MVAHPPSFIAPLTSLRFVAAMGVVLCHSGAYRLEASGALPPIANLLHNGETGVVFFFILSGFILQKVYGGSLENTPAKRRYVWARIARIYPVYVLAMLTTGLFIPDMSWRSLPQFLMLQHWIPQRILKLDNWNFPAWTLSVELFFYLIFPKLSRSATGASVPALLSTIFVIVSTMLILRTPSASIGPTMPMHWMFWTPLPLLRLPEFLFGVALGELSNRPAFEPPCVPTAMIAVVIPVVMCVSTAPVVPPIVAILSGSIIYQIARINKNTFERILTVPTFVLFGGASYSVYLLQVPVRMTFDRLNLTSGSALLLYPAVLVVIATLVFKLVEEPFRDKVRSWSRSR